MSKSLNVNAKVVAIFFNEDKDKVAKVKFQIEGEADARVLLVSAKYMSSNAFRTLLCASQVEEKLIAISITSNVYKDKEQFWANPSSTTNKFDAKAWLANTEA